YHNFRDTGGTWRTHEVSTCVTERPGTQAYTDASTTTAPVGLHYPGTGLEICPTAQIMPLSSNRNSLRNHINGLQVQGSTAGQIGLAWGWYTVSPNFNNLWSGESRPAPYGTPKLIK